MRNYYILNNFITLIAIMFVSCSSFESIENRTDVIRISDVVAKQIAVKHEKLREERYDTVSIFSSSERNLFIDGIENESVAGQYYKLLKDRRYWAICFYDKSIKKDYLYRCSFVVFIDADTGEYITLLNIDYGSIQ